MVVIAIGDDDIVVELEFAVIPDVPAFIADVDAAFAAVKAAAEAV